MVGGGNRRDEGSFTVSNNNVFAALETLRKKKKSDKGSSKGSKSGSKTGAGKSKAAEEEKPVYWAPSPLTVKSWADVDDEDDDDYYATTAPPQAIWGGSGLNKAEETQKSDPVEESESEDELLDEVDDDAEEEHDHEVEVEEEPEPIVRKPTEVSPAPKETERQLSKKERRKKELAELEAILADFGVNPSKEKAEDEPSDVNKDGKEGQLNGDGEKKDTAPTESKNAKKKKKKDKAAKELKEPQDRPNSSDGPREQEQTGGTDHQVEEDTTAVDVKEKLKKMASSKKKKSSKEMDAAARAAAVEAAARSARLAAAKKKEKNHYNQQPIR